MWKIKLYLIDKIVFKTIFDCFIRFTMKNIQDETR